MQMLVLRLKQKSVTFDAEDMDVEHLASQLEVFVEQVKFAYDCSDADDAAEDLGSRRYLSVESLEGSVDVELGFVGFGGFGERGIAQCLRKRRGYAGRGTEQRRVEWEIAGRFEVVLGWEEVEEADLDSFLGKVWEKRRAPRAVNHSPTKGVCPVRRVTDDDYTLESPVGDEFELE